MFATNHATCNGCQTNIQTILFLVVVRVKVTGKFDDTQRQTWKYKWNDYCSGGFYAFVSSKDEHEDKMSSIKTTSSFCSQKSSEFTPKCTYTDLHCSHQHNSIGKACDTLRHTCRLRVKDFSHDVIFRTCCSKLILTWLGILE